MRLTELNRMKLGENQMLSNGTKTMEGTKIDILHVSVRTDGGIWKENGFSVGADIEAIVDGLEEGLLLLASNIETDVAST